MAISSSQCKALINSGVLMPRLLTVPAVTRYCAQAPTDKQIAALLCTEAKEIFYGGAGGPGKSSFLLMDALQYVDQPDYAALILRRTYKDLALPKAIMDRAKEWLIPRGVPWNDQDKTFTFPSSARLVFGYLESSNDKYRYGSAEFQFVGIDEIAQFPDESDPIFLFSRLRRTEGSAIPLRFRAASNPVGPGVGWVRERFIDGARPPDRLFLPAKLSDNPHLDRASYEESLSHLDPVTRARIRDGNWEISDPGSLFDRSWFAIVDAPPAAALSRCRAWDLAASTDGKRTAGVGLVKCAEGLWLVEDVVIGKWKPGERDRIIKQVAEIDGRGVPQIFEQEPGSSGVDQSAAVVKLLSGWRVVFVRPTGNKVTRAGPFASQAQAGNVKLLRGRWNSAYLEELHAAPGVYMDQVDASATGFNFLSARGSGKPPPKIRRGASNNAGEYDEDDLRDGFQPRRLPGMVPPAPDEMAERLDSARLDSML